MNISTTNKKTKRVFAVKLLSIFSLICTIAGCVIRCLLNNNNPISMFFAIIPCVLFLIYIFTFFKKFKASIIFSIVLGMIAFGAGSDFSFMTYIFGYALTGILLLIENVGMLILFALAIYSALTGLNNKVFIKFAFSIGIVIQGLSLINIPIWINTYNTNYAISSLLLVIGKILLYMALLIFASKNRIPAVISVGTKNKNVEKIIPNKH